jgi:viroplasmin and RNaseH domain-containing protein
MTKSKIAAYAVCKGLCSPRVFHSWKDCKPCVNKVSGALFRGYSTVEDAEWGLLNNCVVRPPKNKAKQVLPDED